MKLFLSQFDCTYLITMRIKQQSIEEMLNSFHLNELLRFHNHVKQVLQSTKSQAQ